MTTYTEKDYTLAYERKRESSIKRNIEFELTLEEYTAIMKARPNLTCGYTGKHFNMKSSSHKDYPELDRVCPNSPYSKGNILFVRRCVHKLKTDYIENNRSRKGMSHQNVCMLRSVEKVLNQPNVLDNALKPYYDIYSKVDDREQELIARESAQHQKEETLQHQVYLDEVKSRVELQREMSRHYLKVVEAMESCGVVYGLSMKEHRDLFRVTKDSITGKKFEKYSDKFLWITNKSKVLKTKVIEAGDFTVVGIETQALLDKMETLGDTKTILGNLVKKI